MMSVSRQIEKANTLIVGMGVTGISCARFLRRQNIPFRVVDSRSEPPQLQTFRKEFSDAEISVGSFDNRSLQGIRTLVLSPGIDLRHPFVELARQKGIRIVGDIEIFANYVNAPVIAITGSNGKSTVTTLVGYLLEQAGYKVRTGGNLGTAALDLMTEPPPDFYVLELSSFQLDLMESLQPLAAVVLNVSDDHMDRYSGIDAYTASKAQIYRQAHCCIVNRDDERVRHMPVGKNVLSFGTAAPASAEFGLIQAEGATWLACGPRKLLPVSRMRIQGRHNWMNALAALALLQAAGTEPESVIEYLPAFEGLPHRCRLVAQHNGVHWINDSKATNVGASQAALESFDPPIILIAGGDGKGADFSVLRPAVAGRAKAILLFGRDAGLIEEALSDVSSCVRLRSMEEAVKAAADMARPGDTVLLAPACASLDMYSGYAARGDDFARCVHQVLGSVT
ncbi:MAG TPA: UDP-N-acetylmuramoyl-L-alanine--D-glutamate ligase [Gammaproteobacteria bacterium]